ncbi:MAG: hypothetical protein GOV02_02645 [Candidatus Aenigmarchaeota archaeon]|nr:hypothetical protein [Candidatus Aenigmarchaeota archaeon]
MAIDPVMQMAIPFLFVFAVVFGVLELSLKQWSKPIKAVIALALSFFAITYQPFTSLLWANMGNILFFFIFMFFIAFLGELLQWKKMENPLEKMVVTAIVLFLLLTIGWYVIDLIEFDIPIVGDKDNLFLLVGIMVIVALFLATMKGGEVYHFYETAKAKQAEAHK